jgi:non-ribosomal peptide synthetase component E (peptide arylation enzyme)
MKSQLTLHRPASAQRYHSERMWPEGDFCSPLTGHATERPYAVALQDVCEAMMWGELDRWTPTIAADLYEYGRIGYGRVMMWLSNRIERRLRSLIVRGDRNIHPSHWLLSHLSRPCGQPTCVSHALLAIKNNDFGRLI